ncbi:major facilitator superfamily transporter allantoate, partial [Xylariales sp. PMI_506]
MVSLMLVANGLQFLDKNTLSYAGTYGLTTQANLVGQEYSLLVTIFYIGYLVAQYPANVLMQKFPTGKFIAINFTLWGMCVVLTATGACTSFGSLAACRFLLGVFESCLNPGFVLITSSWWKREEQPARVGIWYAANGIFGAPAGVIFWGIAHISARGLYPYQWMFIIFGVTTVLFSISLFWLLPDSPMTAGFLTESERYIAVDRLKSNRTGIKNTTIKREHIMETLRDVRVWLLVLGVFCHNLTNSLQTTFTGIIIKGFGYSTYDAVLLTIPSACVMAVTMISVSSFLSSRWGEGKRLFTIMVCYVPGVLATALLYSISVGPATKGVLLFAVYIVSCVASCGGIMYSLLASNVAGYSKKVVTGTIFFGAYCLSNIISPQVFLTREAPRYPTAIAVCLAMFSGNIIIFGTLYVLYRRDNKQRDMDAAANGAADAEIDEDMELVNAFSDLTDRQN